ncbi:LysR family transcriptional regulator substrate-binding protein [Vibrio coralliirubri]|uniref:LysR family transcriptional regulator substrate-binding protein n=1 Tax=Vibrio coralliirubri TaxID=1516159 RepID=UPI000A8CB2CC|nr:LysR family transcriptional regulator substrate-binding protein [Vibrio coralliirubri]
MASFGASASTHVLPNLIHAISQHLPQIKIEIIEFTDEGALLALREGRVDFAIAVDKEYLDLESIPILTDRMVALVHEDYPYIPVASFVGFGYRRPRFYLSKGGSEALIREWFKLSKSRLREKHTIVQLTSILALIRAGLGVSIVAELAVPESYPSVNEYPRNICVAKRSGCFSSNAARLTWDFLSKNRSLNYLSKRGH